MTLVERLEEATEGSLELDVEIAAYLSPGEETAYGFAQKVWLGEQPRYTTSIDAALTLVPEGRVWSIGKRVNAIGYVVSLDNYSKSFTAATPALALSIAALKARAETD